MQFFAVASLLASAVAAFPTPSQLKPFSVENLSFTITPSQTQVRFDITDPNSNLSAHCYYSPVLIGGIYTCDTNNNVKYGFSDDLSQMSVAVTWPAGTLDDTEAYYIGNGTAATDNKCTGNSAGEDCVAATPISIPVQNVYGIL